MSGTCLYGACGSALETIELDLPEALEAAPPLAGRCIEARIVTNRITMDKKTRARSIRRCKGVA